MLKFKSQGSPIKSTLHIHPIKVNLKVLVSEQKHYSKEKNCGKLI